MLGNAYVVLNNIRVWTLQVQVSIQLTLLWTDLSSTV